MTRPPGGRAPDQPAATPQQAPPTPPALRATGLSKRFPAGRTIFGRPTGFVNVVDHVDLHVARGATVGVVGESGAGKTTLGRLVAGLTGADAGTIEVNGVDVTRARGQDLKAFRERLQVIFQNSYGALDPTKTIGHAVAEPLLVHGKIGRGAMDAEAARLLQSVALDPALVSRYPEELSGGQRQRACVARALALGPEVLVADEPTSALDLSTRSEILNLLLTLQEDYGQSMLLISHDFATVRHLAHRVVVMYRGRIVEEGPTAAVVEDPQHPYTQALLSAVPVPDLTRRKARTRIVLKPDAPDGRSAHGCSFRGRCPVAIETCASIDPPLVETAPDRLVACVLRSPPASGSHPAQQAPNLLEEQ